MGKRKIIAETGAGQHGVATATTAALFGMECRIFMGVEDIRRQAPNVQRMQLLGAEVVPVSSGTGTLKDAMNEAMRYWVEAVSDTFYIIGSVAGPHPYPMMVRDFQQVIGIEVKQQIQAAAGRLPDALIACVGGGSNAMGLFHPFLEDAVELIGVEAAGKGIGSGKHAAALGAGSVGVLHGSKSYVLQDADGQIREAHSISAGLDYPGVGPEHAFLKETARARYVSVTDDEALHAFQTLCRLEGIIPALESSHALAWAMQEAGRRPKAGPARGQPLGPRRQGPRHRRPAFAGSEGGTRVMNRIDATFEQLTGKNEKALVGFVTAGDPDLGQSLTLVSAMCAAGLDVLELGVPFSDPTADGPVIQRSSAGPSRPEPT